VGDKHSREEVMDRANTSSAGSRSASRVLLENSQGVDPLSVYDSPLEELLSDDGTRPGRVVQESTLASGADGVPRHADDDMSIYDSIYDGVQAVEAWQAEMETGKSDKAAGPSSAPVVLSRPLPPRTSLPLGGEAAQEDGIVDGRAAAERGLAILASLQADLQGGSADSAASSASGPGLIGCAAGTRSSVDISMRDVLGRPADSASSHVEVFGSKGIQGARSVWLGSRVEVSYTAFAAGDYLLSVLVGGAHLNGSPFSVTVVPGQALAERCTCEGPGVSSDPVSASESLSVHVTAVDAYGNRITSSPVTLTFHGVIAPPSPPNASPSSPSSSPSSLVEVLSTPKDMGGGGYELSYAATASGAYAVSVTLLGSHVSGSPYTVHTSPTSASPSSTYAVGEGTKGGLSGSMLTFNVVMRDAFGNMALPGDSPSSHVSATYNGNVLESNEGGTFNFVATASGSVEVLLSDGRHISGSPYQVSVVTEAGPPMGARSEAYPPSLPIMAGEGGGTLVVVARDEMGVRTASRGSAFASNSAVVEAEWMGGKKLNVMDRGDGSYSVSLASTIAGTYPVRVTVAGSELASPVSVTITGAAPSADTSSASPSHGGHCSAGGACEAHIDAKDAYGNPCGSVRPSDIIGVVTHPSTSSQGKMQDGGQSHIRLSSPESMRWSVTRSGTYTLSLLVGGKALQGVPMTFEVAPGAASPRASSVDAYVEAGFVAGTMVSATVRARDVYGNTLPASDSMTYTLELGGTVQEPVCEGGGSWRVSSGTCECLGKRTGLHCERCPEGWYGEACATFAASPSMECSERGILLDTGVCVCGGGYGGEQCGECRPGFGGPDCNHYCLEGVTCKGKCKENGECEPLVVVGGIGDDGAATCMATRSGTYVARVRVSEAAPGGEGGDVEGSPFRVVVSPGAPSASGSVVTPGAESAGGASAEVRVRDEFGNGVSVEAGLMEATLVRQGEDDEGKAMHIFVHPEGIGMVTAFTSDAAVGTYQVHVTLGGVPLESVATFAVMRKGATEPRHLGSDSAQQHRSAVMREPISVHGGCDAPTVKMAGIGGSYPSGSHIVLHAEVGTPECNADAPQPAIEWSVEIMSMDDDAGSDSSDGIAELMARHCNQTLVRIPPGSLYPGVEYLFTVSASSKNEAGPPFTSSASTSISVESPPIRVSIRGGDQRSVTTRDTIDLYAESDAGVVGWSCLPSPCFPGASKMMSRSEGGKLSIPPRVLSPGGYAFFADAVNGLRRGRAAAYLHVLPPTDIGGVAVTGGGEVRPFEEHHLVTDATGDTEWSQTRGIFDVTSFAKDGKLSIPPQAVPPGSEFRLRVQGKDAGAFAEVSVWTPKPPWTGEISIDPKHGFAGETLFKLSCDGWQGQGFDTYEFYYGEDRVPLSPRSPRSEVHTLLLGEGSVTVSVRACNRRGVCTESPGREIELAPSRGGEGEAVARRFIQDAVWRRDAFGVISAARALCSSSPSSSSTSTNDHMPATNAVEALGEAMDGAWDGAESAADVIALCTKAGGSSTSAWITAKKLAEAGDFKSVSRLVTLLTVSARDIASVGEVAATSLPITRSVVRYGGRGVAVAAAGISTRLLCAMDGCGGASAVLIIPNGCRGWVVQLGGGGEGSFEAPRPTEGGLASDVVTAVSSIDKFPHMHARIYAVLLQV
jgi:hypothetical protein